jgi:hypothetical protein
MRFSLRNMDKKQRIIITGGAGFLGSYLVEKYKAAGLPLENVFVPRRADYDLRSERDVVRLFEDYPKADHGGRGQRSEVRGRRDHRTTGPRTTDQKTEGRGQRGLSLSGTINGGTVQACRRP